MNITLEFLERKKMCQAGVDWFKKQTDTDIVVIINNLIKESRFDWANWLLVRVLSYNDQIKYAVYVTAQILNIFEKRYPVNNRPRLAIRTAQNHADYTASLAAADAAADAADAVALALAAAAVAHTASAEDAIYNTDAVYAAAYDKTFVKVIDYGIKLIMNAEKQK